METKMQIDRIRGSLVGGAIGDAFRLSGGVHPFVQGDTSQIWREGNAKDKGRAPVPSICEAYLEWYYTQLGMRSKRFAECWIGTLPELNQRRAPGNTCLTALEMILRGKEPHNQSKGYG